MRWSLVSAAACMVGAASAPAHSQNAPKFEIYGFTQADYIQDFGRMPPAWEDTLRPSRIPTTEGLHGDDGQAIISVRQSRFGVRSNLPLEGSELQTRFEFDLFGVGVDEGQTDALAAVGELLRVEVGAEVALLDRDPRSTGEHVAPVAQGLHDEVTHRAGPVIQLEGRGEERAAPGQRGRLLPGQPALEEGPHPRLATRHRQGRSHDFRDHPGAGPADGRCVRVATEARL